MGGFEAVDIEALLDALDANYLGWSRTMAPVIMGNPDRPELGQRLADSFCSIDPEIARHFARVTFLSDNRADLAHVSVPTLVMQCSTDVIAPVEVGTLCARGDPRKHTRNALRHRPCPDPVGSGRSGPGDPPLRHVNGVRVIRVVHPCPLRPDLDNGRR